MQKTKIALLDLTGCSGCEVNLIRLGASFFDVAQDFEITNWRMLQQEKAFNIYHPQQGGYIMAKKKEKNKHYLTERQYACH